MRVQFVLSGSLEHRQAIHLRTSAFFLDHGGLATARARDRPGADHAVILGDGQVIACGQGHIEAGVYEISQMAVVDNLQGQGLGSRVLQALLERAADHGTRTVRLEAREHATSFYARHGFVAITEARPLGTIGFPHVAMERVAGD